jgi:hypothetical protein
MRSANTTSTTTATGTAGPATVTNSAGGTSGTAVESSAGATDEAVDSGGLANLSLSDGDGADGADGTGTVIVSVLYCCLVHSGYNYIVKALIVAIPVPCTAE